MRDTSVALAQCEKCQAYVFRADSNGLRVMADPAPLAGAQAYVAALVAGRRTFDLIEAAGRPSKLQTRTQHSQAPDFTPEAGRRPVLAEHGCTRADSRAVEVTDTGPHSAPATPGASRGGHHQQDALDGTSPSPAPERSSKNTSRRAVPYATRRHSDRNGRYKPTQTIHLPGLIEKRKPEYVNRVCDTCGRMVGYDTEIIGVQVGIRWVWVQHESCPPATA